MKDKFGLIIFFLVFLFASMTFADYVPGQVVVKFRPGIVKIPKGVKAAAVAAADIKASSVRSLNAKHRVYELKQVYQKVLENRPDWTHLEDEYVLIFPADEDVKKIAQEYTKNPNVEAAYPNTIFHAFDTNPDDPYFVSGQQYGLTNISAPQAWDRTTGSNTVTIAVLDTGINYNHEDFTGRVNLADAYDFVNGDADPLDDHSSAHGTGVSGVIGAATNNAKGVAGVDWQGVILPIKVLDHNGSGTLVHIKEGITWAINKGADVINMSFGQYNESSNKYIEENPGDIRGKCQDAYDAGIVLVAAAGNGNVDWNTYPAYYPIVLGVAAVDSSDERSVWGGTDPITLRTQASNYGTWVSVCAPGTDIMTVYKDTDRYATTSGTSLACPFVAGQAALIKAANPGLSNQQIMNQITIEADDIDSLNPGYEGKLGRRINLYRTVAGLVARILSPESNAYIKGSVNVLGMASGWDFSGYVLQALQSGSLVSTIKSSTSTIESGTLGTWNTTALNGEYTIRLKVLGSGSSSEETNVAVYVDNTTPEATITSPLSAATIEGSVQILGTAQDQYFAKYLLEYGVGTSPSSYVEIKESYLAVNNSVLATWETAGLSGDYILRLTVYDLAGTTSVRTVPVYIRSTSPTREAEPQSGLPLTFSLPNPFDRFATSEVTFNYTLSGNFTTRIYIFNLAGNLIWQNSYSAGTNGGKSGANNPAWNGKDLLGVNVPNGIYLYQVITEQKVLARGKIIVLN